MSVDIKAYDFAALWLRTGGWSNDMDIAKLAELVQDLADDFTADLEADYETATHTDPQR